MSSQAPKQLQQDELIGRVINDRFRIINVIARGGMGRVYRAEQVPLGRLVAIKTLDPRHHGGDQDPQFQQRFFLEASVASKLQHPNTVTVFDYGRTSDGIYFIAMELVEGRSLLSLIREEAPLSSARVIHLGLQIARSLREAHRLDVIHRDLKPGNVLIARHGDEEDFAKVLDFGLVKHVETEQQQELTKAGLFMGSPKYMSPEQIRGERVDARADIYSLGVVMYEMLTGHVPFDRENTVKVLMAHMHEPVPPIQNAECPPGLSDLVMRCLSKAPEGRPSSMDEVILLLKQSTGAPVLMSGSFPLSQEIRLSGSPSATSPGRLITGTPSQAFPLGSHPQNLAGTPSAGFSNSFMRSGAMPQQPGMPVLSPSQQPAPHTSWLPKVAVIGALAIAAGFLALRFTERGDMPTSTPLVTQPVQDPLSAGALPSVEQKPEVTNQPPPAESQHHMVVTLTSNPAGATVIVEGKPYGQTPADIEWWGDLAAPGREVTFVFQKDGFEKVTLVRTLKGEKLTVDAALPKIFKPGGGGRRVEGRPGAKPTGPVVVPDNFKEDPY